MGWKSPGEEQRDKLLRAAEAIEEAKVALDKARKAGASLSVSVTDPIARAVVEIDNALDSLDAGIGAASRKARREAPQAVEPDYHESAVRLAAWITENHPGLTPSVDSGLVVK